VPAKAAELIERYPVGIIEVKATSVYAEQDAVVLALEDEETDSRNLLLVFLKPPEVQWMNRGEERTPAARKSVFWSPVGPRVITATVFARDTPTAAERRSELRE